MEAFASRVSGIVESLGGLQNIMIGFGALAALPFIAALTNIAVGVGVGLKAIAALAVALGAASPVGLAIIAFGAATAAIVANWEAVRDGLAAVWEGIVSIFQSGWDRIKIIIDALGAAQGRFPSLGADPVGPQGQRNFGQRGRAEGFYGPTPPSNDPGMPGGASPMSAPGAMQRGAVDLRVRFDNAPPGTRVETATTGSLIRETRLDVGYGLRVGAAA